MLKSGLIIGGVMFFLGVVLGAVNWLICVCCLTIFAGLGAGYLTGQFDKPNESNSLIRKGALAGLIAGGLGLIGAVIGSLIGAALIGPEQALAQSLALTEDLLRELNLDIPASTLVDPVTFYFSAAITGCCVGLFNLAIMAGFGALGGTLWWSMTGKNQGGMSTPPPSFSQ